MQKESNMSVKEQLMALGMKEEDFGRYESDLYVRVTPVSTKFLETYQFKNQVERFIDQIEHVPFYDFPFAAMKEQMKERELEAEHMKQRMLARINQQHSEDFSLDGLHTAVLRYDDAAFGDNHSVEASCGPWLIKRKENQENPLEFTISNDGNVLVSSSVSNDIAAQSSHFIELKRVRNISDKMFSDICDTVKSVYMFVRMTPDEQQKIQANKDVAR